jgi:hypothetical protein
VASEWPPKKWDYPGHRRTDGWLDDKELRCPNCKQWYVQEYYEYAWGEEVMISRRCRYCRDE